ncbi:TetR/AcrR family transcriptional regulator [Actinosynnema sp. NPDC047251]|uniref:Transcriptional regulator, TetR family n=1 Tax=Saccharothrix espanaensis (strain ATCC 51144 / DSM 44229 / JCM 9112 / NBRC 15066 / NRRL 15764) TaxID=1179773 RepID=K0KDM1_SACES|nr:TetR/AcrR family transcriptional regulator [Saccharothrix espanaensis]CCH34613.1 Transcriptional regulator, TetR family [Saccharothrix espanaensis DSM 44229]
MTADELPSVWTRQRRSRDQPALNRAQIVAEAVALLDAEGIDALTMRRLGTRLDAGATSLYRHVANRDELIELVVDEVYGEIRVPAVGDDWRAAVSGCAASVREMILRHPWIASLLGQVGLSYLGPNVMRLNEGMMVLLADAGFPADEAGPVISTVLAYVIGIGVNEAAWLTTLARSGQTEQDWQRRLGPALTRAVEDYPSLRAQQEQLVGQDPTALRDRNFAYGLDRVLDGLEPRRRA